MGFDTTQGSSCTTARIKTDKSLYRRPALYWNGNNTGFYRVPDMYLKVYYKFGDSGDIRANVTVFPDDFKMIAGNPFRRSDDGDNPGGITWSCKGANYVSIDDVGFPKGFTSCSEGLATQITFPSCWNGNAIDPTNPGAHMAWPTAGGTGIDACPTGFKQARFPSIFIEFWYDVSSFDGQYSADSVPWVLANGDPTGFGFHADFLNGWEEGVLEKAIAPDDYCNCGCGCGNDQMKTCFGAENVNDDDDADFQSCAASAIYGGDDATPLQKLPGCNPIQPGPALATQASGTACNASAATTMSSALNVSSIISSIIAPVSSILDAVSSFIAATSTSTPVSSAASTSMPTSSTKVRSTRTRSKRSSAVLSISRRKAQATPIVTVTVDAAKNSTAHDDSIATTTVTHVTTVTLPAGHMHRRHGDLHKN